MRHNICEKRHTPKKKNLIEILFEIFRSIHIVKRSFQNALNRQAFSFDTRRKISHVYVNCMAKWRHDNCINQKITSFELRSIQHTYWMQQLIFGVLNYDLEKRLHAYTCASFKLIQNQLCKRKSCSHSLDLKFNAFVNDNNKNNKKNNKTTTQDCDAHQNQTWLPDQKWGIWLMLCV